MIIILPILSLFVCIVGFKWQRRHEPDRVTEVCYIALGLNALVMLTVRWAEAKQGYMTGLAPWVSVVGLTLAAGVVAVRWMKGWK